MQNTLIGFNTAGIKYENSFLALMLKTKQKDQQSEIFYLQAPILADLLLVLQNRMAIVIQRLADKGEIYKTELLAVNEKLLANIPQIEMSEIQHPDPARRVMSITLKASENSATLVMVLQNEKIATLRIDDSQVEALIVSIQQSLINTNDQQIVDYLSSNLDFLMLYALDLTKKPNIDYQQYVQDVWKLNLFTHYLGVLFCSDTDEGKKIISGAVIKTSAPHLSEAENNILMRLTEKSPKLKEMHEKHALCQIFSTIIPSQPGRMLTLEECLRPLHKFCLETQATLNA